MKNEHASQPMINERRNYFRVDDKVLLRYQPVEESCAFANTIPQAFKEDPGYSLMRELQSIEQDNAKFLRAIGEQSRDLEAYLKGQNKKLELIAAKVVEQEEQAPDQRKQHISISEGGLSIHSETELANDGYLAIQLTLLPNHHSLVVFAKVINCSEAHQGGYNVALSFTHLKDSDRQLIAKHIMQLQLARRRQETDDQ
ncbi:PilZ domain-containing protein [Oceanicoccus sagamiensis]|uniref:PilZ domain-containing protein n=1 Tax=Oceanicoccus sagamiensis TaxID=716816 RepID=A0A1X9NJ27_9GAMM|nr:PilZ domain-containing protein [Oceanicoccus sagamiensis]ARN75845.1 hypothetical protein BST96_18095 [Oceanicoccus sagamiensis]